jgi:transposase
VTQIICGVDVSSTTLDARIGPDGPSIQVKRTHQGVAELAAFCRLHGAGLAVMEATGGYEKLPFNLLWAAGIPCALANPRAVRRFAEAMGILEKSDRIDTGVIARFAAVKKLAPQPPLPPGQQRLRALSDRLRQITQSIVAQTNQRRLIDDPMVLASIDEVIALLRRQARAFEAAIVDLLDSEPLWQALNAACRSIKGVALRTIARLMAELPEIGTLSGKAIAKLAGLAPLARDSGKHSGNRHVRGGRAGVRSILFIVASIVRRFNRDFADFSKKLLDAGKPRKVIRIALARKLLVRLNAKARDVRQAMPNLS